MDSADKLCTDEYLAPTILAKFISLKKSRKNKFRTKKFGTYKFWHIKFTTNKCWYNKFQTH